MCTTYIQLPARVFYQQTLDCIFLTAELPVPQFYRCLLVKAYYLFELSHQCVSDSFTPDHDVFLLHLNHPGSMVMSDGKSFRRQRERERDAGKWNLLIWCVGACVRWGWLDSVERNRRLVTHPVFLIYELRFEQEVWVSCHHHHVFQLGEEKKKKKKKK